MLEKQVLLPINLIITSKNDNPAIELRKMTTDIDIIKALVTCAINDRPITIMPIFSNRLQALNSLVQKGILYRENDQYFFTL